MAVGDLGYLRAVGLQLSFDVARQQRVAYAGYRTYQTADQSTNCWWVALISWGEGWHNNHHAFPFSARHGLRWFEFDMTWWHVRLLAFLRLADRIKIPSQAMQERLRG